MREQLKLNLWRLKKLRKEIMDIKINRIIHIGKSITKDSINIMVWIDDEPYQYKTCLLKKDEDVDIKFNKCLTEMLIDIQLDLIMNRETYQIILK